MPITADTVTVAQYRETEANVDQVNSGTVNASAGVLLVTPVGQNDQEMLYADFTVWLAGADLTGGASGLNLAAGVVDTVELADAGVTLAKLAADALTNLTVTEAPTNVAVDSSTGTGDTISLVDQTNAGVMSPAEHNKLLGIENAANAYVHPDHTGEVTSVADGALTIEPDAVTTVKIADSNVTTAKIADTNVTLVKMAPDALTDLAITGDADTVSLEATLTGTGAKQLPAASSIAAGTMAAVDKIKLERTVLVTDYGADLTGVQDSSAEIQAAIDFAVANDIGQVIFPGGTYLVESQINLPFDSSGTNRRFEIDLGNSVINTPNDIAIFSRNITADADTETRHWQLTIHDGTFAQTGTKGTGTCIHVEKCQAVNVSNIRASSFKHVTRLAFCLHHYVENVNGTDNLEAFSIVNGAEEYTVGEAANSNNGFLVLCRSQTSDDAAIGFDFKGCANITLMNCTVEGSRVNTCYRFTGTTPEGAVKRSFRMVNCWNEFNSVTGVINNAIVEVDDLDKAVVSVDINGSSWPDTCQFFKNVNSIRCVFEILNSSTFADVSSHTTPWFDADISASATQQNLWRFIGNILFTGDRINDTARWVDNGNGTVPLHPYLVEESFDYNGAEIYDSRLTATPNSLLANADTVNEAIVKPLIQGGLPSALRVAGATVLGWDDSGNLSEFDAQVLTAGSRKEGVDDLGTDAGSMTIDFDTGTYDNKMVTITGTADISLVATRLGAYELWLKRDSSATLHAVTIANTNLEPQTSNVRGNPDSDQVQINRLYWDGTTWHWG